MFREIPMFPTFRAPKMIRHGLHEQKGSYLESAVTAEIGDQRNSQFDVLPAVNDRPGVIERAFQVAKSGKVSNIKDLRTQLAGEGYLNVSVALAGRSLGQQISRMIIEAKMASN